MKSKTIAKVKEALQAIKVFDVYNSSLHDLEVWIAGGRVLKEGMFTDVNMLREQHLRTVSPTIIEREGKLIVSAEDGLGFADAYGNHGCHYIEPQVIKAATDYGCYWEWQDAGSIVLAD